MFSTIIYLSITSIIIYNAYFFKAQYKLKENFVPLLKNARTHYKAAVVEYEPEGRSWEDSGPEIIAKNLENYLNYISNASLNVS
jgi:hypothetical protein